MSVNGAVVHAYSFYFLLPVSSLNKLYAITLSDTE